MFMEAQAGREPHYPHKQGLTLYVSHMLSQQQHCTLRQRGRDFQAQEISTSTQLLALPGGQAAGWVTRASKSLDSSREVIISHRSSHRPRAEISSHVNVKTLMHFNHQAGLPCFIHLKLPVLKKTVGLQFLVWDIRGLKITSHPSNRKSWTKRKGTSLLRFWDIRIQVSLMPPKLERQTGR